MPTPARTSLTEIVSAGRDVLARDGLDGLTMQRVSEAVGVRAPSLYKHVPSRSALVQLVATDVVGDLAGRLEKAATTGDSRHDLRALALTLRDFAHHDPHGFDLIFMRLPEESSPGLARYATAAAPILGVTEALAGPEHALEAARTVTAWAFGFLRMELAGGFQLGGEVPRAFDFGIRTLIAGIGRSADERRAADETSVRERA